MEASEKGWQRNWRNPRAKLNEVQTRVTQGHRQQMQTNTTHDRSGEQTRNTGDPGVSELT